MATTATTAKLIDPGDPRFRILQAELVIEQSHRAVLIVHFIYQQKTMPGKEYLLRLTITAKTNHPSAVVENWDGDKWQPFTYIPTSHMRIDVRVAYLLNAKEQVTAKHFAGDAKDLFNRVATILR